MTERIEKLRKMHRSGHAAISVERLILATEAYQKYAGEPIWIFRAHVLEYVLDRKAVVIRDGEGKTPSGRHEQRQPEAHAIGNVCGMRRYSGLAFGQSRGKCRQTKTDR